MCFKIKYKPIDHIIKLAECLKWKSLHRSVRNHIFELIFHLKMYKLDVSRNLGIIFDESILMY